jgi:hypothetical protein
MNYTVIWTPDAEQELAALWLDSTQRAEVTRASHVLDMRLRADPLNLGESRSEGRRIEFEDPLGVIFRVRSEDMVVEVLHVWVYE